MVSVDVADLEMQPSGSKCSTSTLPPCSDGDMMINSEAVSSAKLKEMEL